MDLYASSVDIHAGLLHLTPGTALKLSSETHRLLTRMHDATELRGYLVPGSEADGELHHHLQVALYNRVHYLGEERLGMNNLTPGMCLTFIDPVYPAPETVKTLIEAAPITVQTRSEQEGQLQKQERKAGQEDLFNVTEIDSDSYRLLSAVARAIGRSTDEVAPTLYPLWVDGESRAVDWRIPEFIRDRLLHLIEREALLKDSLPVIVFTSETHPALVTLLDRELFQLLGYRADLLEVRRGRDTSRENSPLEVSIIRACRSHETSSAGEGKHV